MPVLGYTFGRMGFYRNILACFVLVLLVVFGYAQSPWTVTLNGKVVEGNKALARAVLILKKNGVEVQKLATAPNGKFNIVLEADNDYDLYFTKKGYVTKFISYSTKNVPEDKVSGLYSEFIFELELFKKMEGLNTSVLEFPVFKVKYYPGVKNLDYDKKHENKIRSRLNLLLREYESAKAREEELLTNEIELTEKRKIEEAYSKQLDIASALQKSNQFEEAQDAYRKALEIKPKSSFPKDKIMAIEKLIKERDKSNVLSKAMEERYTILLEQADKALQNEKYASAKSLYKRAALIAPDRPYPKDQIAMVEGELLLIKQRAPFDNLTDERYDLIISRADNEFMGEDYVRARASYLAAAKVKPEAAYPKERISEIDKISAANKLQAVDSSEEKKRKDGRGKKTTKSDPPADVVTKEDMDTYLIALAEAYEEGITEEIEVDGGKKTTRIIVVKDGKATEYKKEVYSWATYYKKNNKNIPRYIFENETKK